MTPQDEQRDRMGREEWGLDTLLIHANQGPDPQTGAITPPIHPSSTFVRQRIDDGARYRYARGANPTREALEAILTDLEHGAGASAFASGMAAVTAALQLLSAGDHAVVGYDCYLSTYHLFANDLPRYGISADFVDLGDLAAVRAALRPNTRMIWIETPTNPLLDIVDLQAIAAIATEAGALTVVDNTFASPYCQNPLDWGIDLVVHSTTKYLGGHSDLLGGAVISRTEELAARITDRQYYLGAVPSPFDCWLLIRGMRTLGVRMRQHMENAQAVAEWLAGHAEGDGRALSGIAEPSGPRARPPPDAGRLQRHGLLHGGGRHPGGATRLRGYPHLPTRDQPGRRRVADLPADRLAGDRSGPPRPDSRLALGAAPRPAPPLGRHRIRPRPDRRPRSRPRLPIKAPGRTGW